MVAFGVAGSIAALVVGTASAGCTTDPDCEDGNPCTHNECSDRGRCRSIQLEVPESSCTPGSPPSACSIDICSAQAACQRVPKCDDGNPCTNDLCDGDGFCSYSPRADGTGCTADACGSAGTCQTHVDASGSTTVCVGAACDDYNPCTEDACGANGSCTHTDKTSGTPCGTDHNDCRLSRCNGRGSCVVKVAAENATCLNPNNVCLPWGLCKGTSQGRTCEILWSACEPGQPCPTDGLDCSGMTLCGLVSACSGGQCVDQTCNVGGSIMACGLRCGSEVVNGLCTAAP
jgi:hypothetical protein